jgi:hypothetical protein
VRVFHHVGEQNPEYRPVQRIDLIVSSADFATCLRVAPDERLQGIGEHLPGQPGHVDDLGLRGDGAGLVQPLRRLRDIDRVIAHPLEIVGDLQRRREHA